MSNITVDRDAHMLEGSIYLWQKRRVAFVMEIKIIKCRKRVMRLRRERREVEWADI